MKCSICGSEIMREWNGWDGGHNAWPINDGRCCGPCNYSVVVPTRLKMHMRKLSHRPQDNHK